MSDEGKTEQNEYDPQAPKYMRPRRPVLDEPLDGFPEDAEVQEEAPEHEAGDTDVQPEPALEPTQELKAQPEPGVQEAWIGVDGPSKPGEVHSPYLRRCPNGRGLLRPGQFHRTGRKGPFG